MKPPIVSKKTLKLAKSYAYLEPQQEYPDLNAAIAFAKALLRLFPSS